MKRVLVIFAGALAVVIMPVAATAHNAGHVFLPGGTCQELGSFREAPLVGQDQVPLDLVPTTPRDEFGVSFVGQTGGTPIFPGACPAVRAATSVADDSIQFSLTVTVSSGWQ